MNKRCPHCGKEFELSVEVVKAESSLVELNILEYLERRAKYHDAPAPTRYIANAIHLGTDQTLRYLIRLEKRGKINRVGERKGWFLP